MGKKSRKTKNSDFRKQTQNTDYRKTDSIAEDLKSAIDDYKQFEILEAGGDYGKAETKLRSAGTTGYQVMEHAYKNFIYHYYHSEHEASRISWSEYNRRTSFVRDIDGKDFTHADLKKAFTEIVPHPNVNLELIFRGADNSNNKPKHDGTTPDPQNIKAQLGEIARFFNKYLDNSVVFPPLSDFRFGNEYAVQEFNEAVDGFSNDYHFILIAPPTIDTDTDLSCLFSVDWNLVLDFNPESDVSGIQYLYRCERQISPTVRTLKSADANKKYRKTVSPHWIMANGIAADETSVKQGFNKWKYSYKSNIYDTLRRFRSEYDKYLKIVVLPGIEKSYLEALVECFEQVFYNDTSDEFYGGDIFLLKGDETAISLDSSILNHCNLSLDDFLMYLHNRETMMPVWEQAKTMPGLKNADDLSRDLCAKLESFSEPVYIHVEDSEPEGDVRDFYTALRTINWKELSEQKDLPRAIYRRGIYTKLHEILQEHPKVLYDIVYKPGYGGTTLLRRIAWDFHGNYPTLLLYKYDEETINPLKQLFEKTKLPLLILADSNYLVREDAEQLRQELRRENINHMILFMRRRKQIGEAMRKSELFTIPELSCEQGEVASMVDLLLPYANEECKQVINEYKAGQKKAEEQSPFYFALSAFDEEFKGIPRYVHHYLNQLPSKFKEYLVYISIADYINSPLSVQFFVNHLKDSKVEDFLCKQLAFKSLVSFKDHNGERCCKIKYPAFANEILSQITSMYDEKESRPIDYIRLSEYILRFIEYSRPNLQVSTSSIVDFLREMLITRREDVDVDKPRFSVLIRSIGGYDPVKRTWSQEGQIAVERIFNKLTEVYYDDPHFNAHRARFLCYVEKSYDEAISILDEAIDSTASYTDPLLLHMKAMVYVARITKKTIPEIDAMHEKNPDNPQIAIHMESLKDDLRRAQTLFKEVRNQKSGLAGYISDIRVCINIIDMQKRIEGVDTAQFWEYHAGDWFMKLGDHANELYEICKEYADDCNDEDKKRIQEITGAMTGIRQGIEQSIKWYKTYLETASGELRPYLRRHLARAYMERNLHKNDPAEWERIIALMEQNMEEQPDNEANIRTWFNAVMHVKSSDPSEMLRQALVRLNQWIDLGENNIEAHFYRFVLTYIRAVETKFSDDEGRLPEYLAKLRSMSSQHEHRTTIRYWLGKQGRGMERLIHKDNFSTGETELAKQRLYMITGNVVKYTNDFHAYIRAYRCNTFFSPHSTDGRISSEAENSPVIFGVGFSYDGPRAYNSSVELFTGQEDINQQNTLPPLEYGVSVQCQVFRNSNPHFIDVHILGYPGEEGSIAIEELSDGYSAVNRPPVNGSYLDAVVLRRKSIPTRQGFKEVWALTMKFKGQVKKENHTNGSMSNQLQAWLDRNKTD